MSTSSVESFLRPAIRLDGGMLHSCRVLDVAVQVSGHDLAGNVFVDQCRTMAVAENGAIVTIARALAPGNEVVLHYGGQEINASVTGQAGNGNYGLCFDVPCSEFWGNLLDVPAGTDPLLVPSHEQFQQPIPSPSQPRAERRRSARVRLRQAKACIEAADGTQDLVELCDVSRGGLCFRSPRYYPLNSFIRVAAPFTPGNTNLFVQARIVRINRNSFGQNYGAEYIR